MPGGPTDSVPDLKQSKTLPILPGPITIDPADPVVVEILSFICIQCGPIAHIFQKAGYPIPTHAEEEQAHVLLWFLALYRDHGKEWKLEGQKELNRLKSLLPKS